MSVVSFSRSATRPLALLLAQVLVSVTFLQPASAIIGGDQESAASWKSSTLILRTAAGTCTATIVGRRVIITAAHCIGTEERRIEWNGGWRSMKCQSHPGFSADQTLGIALCLLDKDIAGTPEQLNVAQAILKQDLKIRLVGFGCRQSGGVDSDIGVLTVGEAKVVSLASDSHSSGFVVSDGSAICFGDTGGGAYVQTDGAGKRILVGVSVRGDLVRKSFIVPTSSDGMVAWMKGWAEAAKVGICGLGDATACDPAGFFTFASSPERPPSAEAVKKQLSGVTPSLIQPPSGPPSAAAEKLSVTQVVPVRAKETVYDLVARVCKDPQPDTYYRELDRRFGIGPSTRFDFDRNVSIPVCSAANASSKVIETKKDDTARKLYEDAKAAGASTWKGYERPAGVEDQKEKSEYFLDVFRAINPGKDPNKLDGATVFAPTAPLSDLTASTLAISTPGHQAIIALQSDTGLCKSEPRDPFDLGQVLDALRRNRVVDRRDRDTPARVFIADSGLMGLQSSAGIFTPDIVLGWSDTPEFLNKISPQYEGGDSSHGTQVASMVLGGPLFGRIQANFRVRVKVAMASIYGSFVVAGQPWVGTKDQAFALAMKEAKKAHHADIVNLSIKTATKIVAIEDQSALADFLIVVAAGNHDGDLKNDPPIYPARFGGPSNRSLLTVAALDGDEPAAWSNYGRDWVEIAALGCGIPVLSFDRKLNRWKQERLSGTSIAAPVVSFAAALLKSEPGDWNPMLLKQRLLASADLNQRFEAKIADGRYLNVVKALSIYQDVVEVADRGLIFGELTFKYKGTVIAGVKTFDVDCSDGRLTRPESLKVVDVLKIRPKYAASGANSIAKIYSANGDAQTGPLFHNRECILPAQLELSITEPGASQPTPLPWDQVLDVIPRVRFP